MPKLPVSTLNGRRPPGSRPHVRLRNRQSVNKLHGLRKMPPVPRLNALQLRKLLVPKLPDLRPRKPRGTRKSRVSRLRGLPPKRPRVLLLNVPLLRKLPALQRPKLHASNLPDWLPKRRPAFKLPASRPNNKPARGHPAGPPRPRNPRHPTKPWS